MGWWTQDDKTRLGEEKIALVVEAAGWAQEQPARPVKARVLEVPAVCCRR